MQQLVVINTRTNQTNMFKKNKNILFLYVL